MRFLVSELYEMSAGPEKDHEGATPWAFISNWLMKRWGNEADIYRENTFRTEVDLKKMTDTICQIF